MESNIQGRGNVAAAAKAGENIVALCDVDQDAAAGDFKKYPQAKAGQTHLNWDAEQAEEVRVIPIGIELFAAHSAFPGLFPFQQIESQAA